MKTLIVVCLAIFGVSAAQLKSEGPQEVICKEGFTKLGEGCYYFSTNHKSWYGALQTCVSLGANLASVENSEENELIKEHLRSLANNKNYWISGIDDSQEGFFVWTNNLNPVIFTDWCSGDPNNYGVENCLYFGASCDYKWQDRNCDFASGRYISVDENWWISGNDDQQEGYFIWISSLKPVIFTDWCDTDPNNVYGENCLRFVYECDFAWQDHGCSNAYTRFICEQ